MLPLVVVLLVAVLAVALTGGVLEYERRAHLENRKLHPAGAQLF